MSEMHSIFVRVIKYKMHVISKVREYVISVICKSKLTKSNNISQPIFTVSKCSKDISSKFKVMKFIPE